MGLPGAGKTTLASKLVKLLNAKWLNADEIRKEANDWDFSTEGRNRQAQRMADFANKYKSEGHIVIADFGAACTEDESYEEDFGTRYYRAPEVILLGEITSKVDIWAAGCILYELINGSFLFEPWHVRKRGSNIPPIRHSVDSRIGYSQIQTQL